MEVKQMYVAEGHRKGYNKQSPTIKSNPMSLDDCLNWADENLNYETTVKITRTNEAKVI